MNWRKSTWALILCAVLAALWEGYLGSILNCAYADQVCHAKETSNYTVVFLLWTIVAVPMAIFWVRSRPNRSRSCPVCATSVPAGLVRCQRCGFDFWAAAAGTAVPQAPVYSACWWCRAPVIRGQAACNVCGAQLAWQMPPPPTQGLPLHAHTATGAWQAQTGPAEARARDRSGTHTNEWDGAVTERDELADIEQWFASRGFGFRCWKDDAGVTWADLISPASGSVVAPRYGRGSTPIEAARSAKDRYLVEQG